MSTGKKWTPEEIEYLEDKWGVISIPSIAKKLGRTIEAVKVRAQRMGLGRHIHSGPLITLSQLCEALGDRNRNYYRAAKARWVRFGFPLRYQKSLNCRRYAMVDIDEFWTWAENNKDLVDLSHMAEGILGREPPWVKEARRAKAAEKLKKSPWTSDEDCKLRHMLKSGKYGYDDLSAALMRSENAVKRRIFELGIAERPLKKQTRKWTDDEVNTMLKMRDAGHSWEAIAKRLGRTSLSVQGCYDRLINPGYQRAYRCRHGTAKGSPDDSAAVFEWTPKKAKPPGELLKERKDKE